MLHKGEPWGAGRHGPSAVAGRVLSGDHPSGSAFRFLFGERMAAWVREEPA